MNATLAESLKQQVRQRYTSAVSGDPDEGCEPGSCCDIGYSVSELASAPEDAGQKSLGCGNPLAFADARPGEVVLDIGSGAGLDVILAAKRVGFEGRAIGLDMTPEMVAAARKNAVKAGAANAEFKLGDAEDMPLGDASVDLVVSNCVINLAPDKRRVYTEIARVLKPGGRLSVSDIVAEALPRAVREDPAAWSACLGGALPEEEYLGTIREAGIEDVEVAHRVDLDSAAIKAMFGAGVARRIGRAVVKSITVKGTKPAARKGN